MVTLGATISVPNVRISSPTQTYNCVWVVESTLGAEVERINWSIVNAVGLPSIYASGQVTARSNTKPNFSSYPSRMPNAQIGMAPVEGYSLELQLGEDASPIVPFGAVRIIAIAYGKDGSATVLPDIYFNNDSDGVDRRASTKVIYWAASTGSNSNNGLTNLTPVKDLHKAIQLACVANNCGGATIHMLENHAGGGGAVSPGNWHTGEHDWLTILCANGVTWSRIDPPNSQSADDISMTGNGSGTYCNVRIQNYTVLGTGPIWNCGAGVTGAIWREGGVHRSAYWDGSVSALCIQDSDEIPFDIQPRTASSSIHKSYCTGELRQGARIAYSAETLIFDCKVQGTLGGACYIQSWYQAAKLHSIVCSEHSYERNVTRGWACNQADGFLPLDPLEVQKIGSTMRILGPSAGTPIPFSTQAAEMVGAPKMGIFTQGFANAANNGTQFAVLAAGTTGGRHYIDLANAACVAEGPTAGALLETSYNGVRYNIAVHTSYISFGTSRTGDDMFRDIALFDIDDETQGAFDNGADHTRLLIDNVRGSGGFSNLNFLTTDVPPTPISITDSIIRRCSWTGSTLLCHPTLVTYTGTVFENCVFNSISSDIVGAIANGLTMRYCHAITGSVYGTNGTTGAWLAGDPLTAPFSVEPTSGNKGTGHPLMSNHETWQWDASQSTKGCLKNTALLTWDTTAGATTIVATGDLQGFSVTAAPAGSALTGKVASGDLVGMTIAPLTGVGRTGTVASGSLAGMTISPMSGTAFVGDPPEPEEPDEPPINRSGQVVSKRAMQWWDRF